MSRAARQRFALTCLPQPSQLGSGLVSAFTLDLWIRFNGSVPDATFFSSSAPGMLSTEDPNTAIEWGVRNISGNATAYFRINTIEAGDSGPVFSGTNDILPDTIYHIVLTFDGKIARYYVTPMTSSTIVQVASYTFDGAGGYHIKQNNWEEVTLNGTTSALYLFETDAGQGGADEIDCFRFSDVVRYVANDPRPTEKFAPDEHCLALMTFEDQYRRFTGCWTNFGGQAWLPLTDWVLRTEDLNTVLGNFTIESGLCGHVGIDMQHTLGAQVKNIHATALSAFKITNNCYGSTYQNLTGTATSSFAGKIPKQGFLFACGGPNLIQNIGNANSGGRYPLVLMHGGYSIDTTFIGPAFEDGILAYIAGAETTVNARRLVCSNEAAPGEERAGLVLCGADEVSLEMPSVDNLLAVGVAPVIIDGGRSVQITLPNFNAPNNESGGLVHVVRKPEQFVMTGARGSANSESTGVPFFAETSLGLPVCLPQSVNGYLEVNFESDDELSLTLDDCRNYTIRMTDTNEVLTGPQNVILPPFVGITHAFHNATLHDLVFKTPGGMGVRVQPEQSAIIVCDGENILSNAGGEPDPGIAELTPFLIFGENLVGEYSGDLGYGSVTWLDQTSYHNDLTLTGTSVGDTVNGHASVRANGINQGATLANFDLNGSGVIFTACVCKVISPGTGRKVFAAYGSAGAFDLHGIGHDGGIFQAFNAVAAVTGSTDLEGTWHAVSTLQKASPSTDKGYVDATEETSQAGVGAVNDNLAFTLFYMEGGYLCNADIAYCVVVNAEPTEQQLADLQTFFTERFDL